MHWYRKEEIRELFESEGEIVDVYLPKDYYTGEQRGFGFVEYKTEAEAENAVRKVPYASTTLDTCRRAVTLM